MADFTAADMRDHAADVIAQWLPGYTSAGIAGDSPQHRIRHARTEGDAMVFTAEAPGGNVRTFRIFVSVSEGDA